MDTICIQNSYRMYIQNKSHISTYFDPFIVHYLGMAKHESKYQINELMNYIYH